MNFARPFCAFCVILLSLQNPSTLLGLQDEIPVHRLTAEGLDDAFVSGQTNAVVAEQEDPKTLNHSGVDRAHDSCNSEKEVERLGSAEATAEATTEIEANDLTGGVACSGKHTVKTIWELFETSASASTTPYGIAVYESDQYFDLNEDDHNVTIRVELKIDIQCTNWDSIPVGKKVGRVWNPAIKIEIFHRGGGVFKLVGHVTEDAVGEGASGLVPYLEFYRPGTGEEPFSEPFFRSFPWSFDEDGAKYVSYSEEVKTFFSSRVEGGGIRPRKGLMPAGDDTATLEFSIKTESEVVNWSDDN